MEERARGADDAWAQFEQAFEVFLERAEGVDEPSAAVDEGVAELLAQMSARPDEGGGASDGVRGFPDLGLAGDRLGEFRLLRELGRGGMGIVFEAQDLVLDRRVALKVLPPWSAGQPRGRTRFRREARAGGRLSHPGIVAVYGVGEAEGLPYIAQQLVEGGRTLDEWARELWAAGPSVPAACARITAMFLRVAEALAAAHEAGVVHRDVKPGNVLVDREGRPLVADFGLARLLDAQLISQSGSFKGTPSYASPEQLGGGATDGRADVFSLGATLYEALTARRAFEGESQPEVIARVLRHEPPPAHAVRPGVPPDLSAICARALEKAPRHRYPSMAAMADDLRRFAHGEPTIARPAGALRRVWKWCRRNPARAVAGGAIAAVAVLAVVLFSMRAGIEEKELPRRVVGLVDRASQLWPIADSSGSREEAWRQLGPLCGEWIREAQTLAALRPRLEELASRMRANAGGVEPLPAFQLADLEAELDNNLRRIEARQFGLDVLDGTTLLEEETRRARPLPGTVFERLNSAKLLVAPDRPNQRSPLPAALATLEHVVRELEEAPSADLRKKTLAYEGLAWARLAGGQDELALEASTMAIELTPEALRWEIELFHHRLLALAVEPAAARLNRELAELRRDQERWERAMEAGRPRSANLAEAERYARIVQAIDLIDALADDEAGLLRGSRPGDSGWSVGRRRELAEAVLSFARSGADGHPTWEDAIQAIGDPAGQYGGLRIGPQVGLVPLGPDPSSHLWEFAHLPTGTIPVRPGGGSLEIEEDTCVVLVLVPGGLFVDPTGELEQPVALDPFLISKYELTQSQWVTFAGPPAALERSNNPSRFQPGATWSAHFATGRNPVEQVTWVRANTWLPRVQLTLPSEIQWEYACRAGTKRAWWTGTEARSLAGAANIWDAWAAATSNVGGPERIPGEEGIDDGHKVHAPVGSFAANAWGLHDVHGNVAEWCADRPCVRSVRPQDGDGRRAKDCNGSGLKERSFRGGSHDDLAADASCVSRGGVAETEKAPTVGIRPARSLDPLPGVE